MRLPQNVPRPVTRIRTGSAPPDAAPVAQQVVDLRLDQRPDPLGLLHHHAAVVAGEAGLHVEVIGGSTRMRNFAGSGST